MHSLDKLEKRRQKLAAQQAGLAQVPTDNIQSSLPVPVLTSADIIDCACVIHGDAYSWGYVERLYNMLRRHITPTIRFHVYTEADRPVPEHMIRHDLEPWHITRARRAWWYKMQMFNPQHHAGPLLYFDLDTVIVRNIDWIWQQPLQYFWAVRDFKYLWRPTHTGINSSIMWWDTRQYQQVWQSFCTQDLVTVMRKYHGDQDYIGAVIPQNQRRFLDSDSVISWRWQCQDGGYDFRRRRGRIPGTGTQIPESASVLVFHGSPKPDKITDVQVLQHWR